MKRAPRLDAVSAALLPDPQVDLLHFLEGVASLGDVVAFSYGGREQILVNIPDVVHGVLAGQFEELASSPTKEPQRSVLGDGLLTTAGPQWRPRRVLVQRELSHRNVRRFAEVFAENTLRRIRQWRLQVEIDLQDEMDELALDNLGSALFASDFKAFRQLLKSTLRTVLKTMDDATTGEVTADDLAELDEAARQLEPFVQALIADRRANPGEDILSVLVAAAGEAEPAFHERWVRDEAITLLVAGHEQTALTATMACYLLARHPDVADALREDLEDAIGRGVPHSRLVDDVDLARNVVEETLRLYPPGYVLHRSVVRDVELGGYLVEAGTDVVVSPWVTHRDPRYFAEPARFDPWRFDSAHRRSILRHAYFPFGSGPRMCVANHFALFEVSTMVGLTTLHTHVELVDPNEPVFSPGISLRCAEGMPVVVRPVQRRVAGRA